MRKLLLCTNNVGKFIEINDLLQNSGFATVSPKDIDLDIDVAETETTYSGNAVLKAKAFGERSGLLSLADDTGLEVEALDGAPGVQSKRFFKTSGEARNRELLNLIKDNSNRKAKFVASVAVFDPKTGRTQTFSGEVAGEIIEPKGETHADLGYDSIFLIKQLGKTFAEATLQEKNTLSHRAIAVKRSLQYLNGYQ